MKYLTRTDIEAARQLISPPGDTLLETLEEKGISQTELANRMKRPLKTINEIIKGKTAIMPETAFQLGRVLGISAGFWLERERRYQLELASIREGENLLKDQEWAKLFPVSTMMKYGWITVKSNSLPGKTEALLRFFAVSGVDSFYSFYAEYYAYAPHYRTSKAGNRSEYALAAWLRQGEITASGMDTPEFDKTVFQEGLKDAREIMAAQTGNFFPELQQICSRAGVKLVHTPCLPNTSVHGSTRWINDHPVIQLSNHYQRNDIFWFTFFHEAGHVLKHGKKDFFVEGYEHAKEDPLKEKEADEFSIKHTFPLKEEERLKKEINRVEDKVEYIRSFAREIQTHPALIFGRLAREKVLHDSDGWKHGIYRKIDLSTSQSRF